MVEYAEVKAQHLLKSVKFALVTNLTCMSQEKLDYLLEHAVSISTSLDGPEDLHNTNRVYTKGNSFQEVTQWIQDINEVYLDRGYKTKLGALLTVTKQTIPRYKEVIDTYVNL